jgi:glycosyltransferase involved in cell wall biosynthesis
VHLGFSGRLVRAKGPGYAVDVARALSRDGAKVRLTVMGGGELEPELRRMGSGTVRFAGGLRFADEWTRYVREDIDLMVLPHLLGDPSGTYLESAGCGVPVLGFDNIALSSLVGRHGIGWTVPIQDTAALIDMARRIVADGTGWQRARSHGLAFMADHHVDAEFRRRVEHLRALAAS